MRYVPDATWRWVGDGALLAGSPHRLFRLTPTGVDVARSIEAGEPVGPSGLLDRLLDAGAVHPVAATSGDATHFGRSDVAIVTPQFGGVAMPDGRVTVDDASDPPLAGAAVRLDVNVGPGGARNAGCAATSTPLVLFLDADVDVPELDPSHPRHDAWWAALVGHFDDARVGLVAPRVMGDDGSSLDLGEAPGRIRSGTRLSYVPGAAILVRREAFDAVGGFDPTLRVGEDVDLVWRLDQAGWRCRFEPAAQVHHRPRPNFVEQLRQQVKYGSSSGPLALRHPHALAPYASGVWTAVGWALFGAGRTIVAAGVGVLSVARFATADTGLDRRSAIRVAVDGHRAAGEQALVAIRRAWWPLLVPFLWSRRTRRLLVLALGAAPARVAKDVAFSIGLWSSMRSSRTIRPIVPRIRGGR